MHAGEVRLRTLAEYREQIRQITRQGLIDIMLMSTSNNQILTIDEGLFETSHVTPAARANDASDVFAVRHGRYLGESARPFRTALLDHIQCGHVDCDEAERARGANLGLYSVTFNNRLDEDLVTLDEYKAFREEAEQKGFRHFFEVFDPNNPEGLTGEQIPQFVNDSIARTLAGVATAGRPIFLKVVYHGPKSMEELVTYDPHLIVGILGGMPAPRTTRSSCSAKHRNTAPGPPCSAARSTAPTASWPLSSFCGGSPTAKSRPRKRSRRTTPCWGT